jgi:hypothetical protein
VSPGAQAKLTTALASLPVCLAALLVAGPPAHSSNTVGSRLFTWPARKVPFTMCEQVIGDLKGAALATRLEQRGCKKEQLLSPDMAARTRSAVELWNKTFPDNVTFVERSVKGDETSLLVFSGRSACETRAIGHNPGMDYHRIWLNTGCGTYVILHEMMHALGVYHEQKRGDRDKYLDVGPAPPSDDPEVRRQQRRWAYQYVPTGTCLGDYDFKSVMHYAVVRDDPKGVFPRVAPTKTGLARLAEQSYALGDVGQRKTLSPDDVAAIKALYPAPSLAEPNPPVCPEKNKQRAFLR